MKLRTGLAALLLAAVLLSGCAMSTVEDMYSPPRRSDEFHHLQSAIDQAMVGMDYCAPISGENQQTVQMADLDGDGKEEYLIFARGTTEKTLQILIFNQLSERKYALLDVISCSGSAFEQVVYAEIDQTPGLEIVVGRQVSDQLLRSVSVYSFANGKAEQLLGTSYSRFLTCDLDGDGRHEIMVLQPGEDDADNAFAVLLRYQDGSVERSGEVNLSGSAANIKRIMVSRLHGSIPAVYVASTVDESAIITDVFAMKDGKFTNISLSNESGTSVQTLRNYYVYADDIDDDGILELPSLITMQPVTSGRSWEKQCLIRWFAMDLNGKETDKLYTFHNYVGGWYLQLDSGWASRVTVEQANGNYTFYVWDEDYREATEIFTIFVLTDSGRDQEAQENNRFALYRGESVVYAAKLETASVIYGITQDILINSFRLIHQDWNTGET